METADCQVFISKALVSALQIAQAEEIQVMLLLHSHLQIPKLVYELVWSDGKSSKKIGPLCGPCGTQYFRHPVQQRHFLK